MDVQEIRKQLLGKLLVKKGGSEENAENKVVIDTNEYYRDLHGNWMRFNPISLTDRVIMPIEQFSKLVVEDEGGAIEMIDERTRIRNGVKQIKNKRGRWVSEKRYLSALARYEQNLADGGPGIGS